MRSKDRSSNHFNGVHALMELNVDNREMVDMNYNENNRYDNTSSLASGKGVGVDICLIRLVMRRVKLRGARQYGEAQVAADDFFSLCNARSE